MPGAFEITEKQGGVRQFYCTPGPRIFISIRPVAIIRNLRKEVVISRCLIRHRLICPFPDNIQVRHGRRVLLNRAGAYQQSTAYMADPPPECCVFQIVPDDSFRTRRMTQDRQVPAADYETAVRPGKTFAASRPRPAKLLRDETATMGGLYPEKQ